MEPKIAPEEFQLNWGPLLKKQFAGKLQQESKDPRAFITGEWKNIQAICKNPQRASECQGHIQDLQKYMKEVCRAPCPALNQWMEMLNQQELKISSDIVESKQVLPDFVSAIWKELPPIEDKMKPIVHVLSKRIQQLENDKAIRNAQLQTLSLELSSLRAMRKAQQTFEQSTKNKSQLLDLLGRKTCETKSLEAKIQKLEADKSESEMNIALDRRAMQTLKQENQEIKQKLKTMTDVKQSNELQQQILVTQEVARNYQEEIQKLRSDIQKIDSEKNQLEQKLHQAQADNSCREQDLQQAIETVFQPGWFQQLDLAPDHPLATLLAPIQDQTPQEVFDFLVGMFQKSQCLQKQSRSQCAELFLTLIGRLNGFLCKSPEKKKQCSQIFAAWFNQENWANGILSWMASRFEQDIAENKRTILTLQTRVAAGTFEAENQLKEEQKKLEETTKTLATLIQTMNDIDREKEQTQEYIRSQEKMLQDYKATKSLLKKVTSQQKALLTEKKLTQEALQTIMQSLGSSLSRGKPKLSQALEQTIREIKSQDQRYQDTVQKLQSTEKELQLNGDHITRLQVSLDQKELEIADLNKQITENQREIRDLKVQLDEITKRFQQSESRIAILQGQLQDQEKTEQKYATGPRVGTRMALQRLQRQKAITESRLNREVQTKARTTADFLRTSELISNAAEKERLLILVP